MFRRRTPVLPGIDPTAVHRIAEQFVRLEKKQVRLESTGGHDDGKRAGLVADEANVLGDQLRALLAAAQPGRPMKLDVASLYCVPVPSEGRVVLLVLEWNKTKGEDDTSAHVVSVRMLPGVGGRADDPLDD